MFAYHVKDKNNLHILDWEWGVTYCGLSINQNLVFNEIKNDSDNFSMCKKCSENKKLNRHYFQ